MTIPASRSSLGQAVLQRGEQPLEAERRVLARHAVIGVAELVVADELAEPAGVEEGVERRPVPPGEEFEQEILEFHRGGVVEGREAGRTMAMRAAPVQLNFAPGGLHRSCAQRATTLSDRVMRRILNTPKKGDRLLRSSDHWVMTAMYAQDRVMREVCLWQGYMKAGAALIDETQRQPLQRNVLLYPIFFNYRHGLETAMKWIIELYGCLGSVERDETDGHDLLALWTKCRKIFKSVPEFSSDETLEAVEQIVKDFHNIDKNALSFRYSKKRNGKMISLPNNIIDLQNVRGVMEAVDNFFHKVYTFLGNIILP